MDHRRRSGELLEHCQRADVIDVCVRRDYRSHSQTVTLQRREDTIGFVARIDHDGVFARLITDDDAIAL